VLVIGLTGGIASGKSTVAELLGRHGAAVLDADLLGHEVYKPQQPAWRAILDEFGEGLAGGDGEIDRRKLASVVFNDSAAMKRLTDIVWPTMKAEMSKRLALCASNGSRVAVLEAAVLLEAGWDDLVDEVWVVMTPPEIAIARLIERSGFTEADARSRLAAQMTNDERAARADLVIENSGGVEQLSKRVDGLWEDALRRAA
jgi:dephospho-CoA kinase